MKHRLIYITSLIFLCVSCQKEETLVSLGLDDYYTVARMQKLFLKPALEGEGYSWKIYSPDGTLIRESDAKDLIFVEAEEGVYKVDFNIEDDAAPIYHTISINVLHEEVEYSPYISKVYEYQPAPGQFVNELPMYESGDTGADMLRKVEESICGDSGVAITLGGFGGYVVFGFDHTIVNSGEYDFMILGNAFYDSMAGDRAGGNAEPGIVCVSIDANGNGLADDPWYELAGSEYYKPSTVKGYTISYSRPATDSDNIAWRDNTGESGFIKRVAAHLQPYYPEWISDEKLDFEGTCLAPNAVDPSGKGSYYVLYSYDWGYADNHPDKERDKCSFKIDWAVDAMGNRVYLPGVDFVKVYTGVNQQCGWVGETSTEVCGAISLGIKKYE